MKRNILLCLLIVIAFFSQTDARVQSTNLVQVTRGGRGGSRGGRSSFRSRSFRGHRVVRRRIIRRRVVHVGGYGYRSYGYAYGGAYYGDSIKWGSTESYIALGIIGGIVFIGTLVGICCCCCHSRYHREVDYGSNYDGSGPVYVNDYYDDGPFDGGYGYGGGYVEEVVVDYGGYDEGGGYDDGY